MLHAFIKKLRYKSSPCEIISKYVKIETSANCNARCSWCWMFQSKNKPSGLMSFDNYKKLIDLNKLYFQAHKIGIMPYFNGECLIHPRIFDIFDHTVKSKIKLMDLDTNLGMKLDISKLLSFPFKYIRVNIGGLTKEVHEKEMKTDFEIVVSNLKEAFHINPKRLYVKMVVTKNNHSQIPNFKSFIKELGGIPEQTIIAPTSFTSPTLASNDIKKKFFEDVISKDIDEYLKFDYDDTKPDFDIRSRDNKCQYLLNCIRYDGSLTICCQDQLGNINLGNAFESPLHELVTTDNYKKSLIKAEKMGFSFCKECN